MGIIRSTRSDREPLGKYLGPTDSNLESHLCPFTQFCIQMGTGQIARGFLSTNFSIFSCIALLLIQFLLVPTRTAVVYKCAHRDLVFQLRVWSVSVLRGAGLEEPFKWLASFL